jgi:hypothetical protein
MTFEDATPALTHAVTLTNLSPGTDYYYRALSSSASDAVASSVRSFRTFTTSGPASFVVFGDGGWNSGPQYDLADVMRRSNADFAIEVGDIVYPSFTAVLVDPRCFSVYGPHMANTPYFFVLGNHDLLAGVANYLDAFYLPTNSVPLSVHATTQTSPEHYYSFEHGDAHFTALYIPFINQYQLTVHDPQYDWLTNDLATTKQPWKIVFCHVPMNSSSAHRFDDFNFNGIYDRLEIRDVLLPVLSKYGVQLILSGHEHGYERFAPTNGVHFITTAGGGVGLYGLSELDFASSFFAVRYNCVKVTIQGDTLEAQALGNDGEVFDAMTIQRRLPPPKVCPSAWRSPTLLNSGTASDGGEPPNPAPPFDFAGDAIPTFPGKFSNLGRAYVNNDQTNLYIGFERVMMHPDNNVFLLVGSSRQAGLANLADLGNGVIDPDAQGADGLDFLANLSFRNFYPSVGCILGDAHASGQFRSYTRTNLALNIGQGIFQLDAALSDVPGSRLQQFNLTPSFGGVPNEPSAGFIELSFPLAALGSPQPGDLIQIGAVVGGAEFDPTSQARFLDSGFLGYAMTGNGLDPVSLEGLEVRLAFDPDADEDHDGLTRRQELALGTDPTRSDSDEDGLPDGWEVANHLNPLSSTGDDGGASDPDHDGSSNLQEYLAGTDPHDPESALRIRLQFSNARTLRLSWPALPGRTYQVQFSRNPLATFEDLPGGTFPSSAVRTNLTFDLDLSSGGAAWNFYRIKSEP